MFRRTGYIKMFRKGLFVLGVLLCIYAWFGDAAVSKTETSYQIGQLDIPQIGVSLPIYSKTNETLLQTGVVHIAGTNLPGEGEMGHCLLAGHRGLPGRRLLANLDEVKIGDRFYIRLENQQLVYKICNIQTMLPEEVQSISLETGRELISIITCTPYGIHTHRLVVTGERIKSK